MSLNEEINQLICCCQYLECDKTTVRKKNAEKLKTLLSLDEVIKWLHAQNHQQKDMSFTIIFKCVQGYLIKESEIARKKHDSVSSLSPLDDPKLAYSEKLLRHVVEVANKHEPMIKCQELIESINKILKEKFYRHHFASLYMGLLSSFVLKYKKYAEMITSKNYEELLLSCVKIYNKSSKDSAICVQVTDVMKKLIKCIAQHCPASRHQYLFEFFKKSFQEFSDDCMSSAMDSLLWSLFHYSQWQLSSSSDLVYDLADITLPVIVSSLSKTKISPHGFSSAISFCLLQIKPFCLDHSNAVLFIQPQYNERMEILKQMFAMLHMKFYSDYGRFYRKKTFTIDSTVVELASTLLHLFIAFDLQDDFVTTEETNAIMSTRVPTHASPWTQIIRLLAFSNSGSSSVQLVWLRVVDRLLTKFPDDLPTYEVTPFVDCLYQVLSSAKNEDVHSAAFHVLASLLQTSAMGERASKPEYVFWPQLWEIAKRQACLINPGQSQSSQLAFEVMTSLLKCDAYSKILDECDTSLVNVWPILCLSILPSQSMIDCLVTLLREKMWIDPTSGFGVNGESKIEPVFPLRCAILEWLLKSKDVSLERHMLVTRNNTEDTLDSHAVYKIPNLLVSFWSKNAPPPEINSVMELITCLCSFRLFNIKENVFVNGREGDNAADQEKILLKPLCKLVENFASSVISSMIENLSSILSTSNLKTAFSEKMISMSLYFIRLFTSVSLKLGEGFCFFPENGNLILEKNIQLTESILHSCCEEVLEMSRIVDYFYEYIQTLCACKLDTEKNPSIDLTLHQLKELCVSLLIWSLTYFGGHCTPNSGTLHSTLPNQSFLLNFGDDLANVSCTGKKRLLDNADIMSQPLPKYPRLSQTSDELHSMIDNSVKNDIVCDLVCKEMIENPKINFCSSLLGNLCHESLHNFDELQYCFDDFFRICEKSLMICRDLCYILNNPSIIVDVYDAVFATDTFDLMNAKHISVYMSYIKLFSKIPVSDVISWSEVAKIICDEKDILRNHYRNQVVYCNWLDLVPHVITLLLNFSGESAANDCLSSVLSHLETIEKLVKKGDCCNEVQLAIVECLGALSRTCMISNETNFFSHLNKYEVCEKHAQFLMDANMSIVLACAKTSSEIYQLAEDESVLSRRSFYDKVLQLVKKVGENVLKTLSSCSDQPWKALSYVYAYLELLWNVLPYSSHNVNYVVAHETCYFASSASAYFNSEDKTKFVSLMQNFLISIENRWDVSSKSFSLKQHLPYILSNWLISDDWANFPYYFFKSESLKKFFVDHVNEAMPVLLINCLCNKRKLDAVFNLFEDVNLLNILPAFVGAFLACAYSHGSTLNREDAFTGAFNMMQSLHLKFKSTAPLQANLKACVPKILSRCLYFFSPTNNDAPCPLPFVLSEKAVLACFFTILEFHSSGKFEPTRKKFDVNSLLAYLVSSPGLLQKFLLGMRELLQSASSYKEQDRLIQVYSFVWSMLKAFPCVAGNHWKQVVVTSNVFALTFQLNKAVQQILNARKSFVLYELSNVASSCLEMLSAIYEDSLSASACTYMLCDDTIVLNVCCSVVYTGHVFSFLSDDASKLNKLSQSLQMFLSLLARDQFANAICQMILLSFPSLNFAEHLQVPPLQSKHLLVSLVEVVLKITKANLFQPARSVVVEGLLQHLLKLLKKIGDVRDSSFKSLFGKFYVKFASSSTHKLHKNIFAECVEAFQLDSLDQRCLMRVNTKTHPMKEVLIFLCDLYLMEESDEADVAHGCLLNLRNSEKILEFFEKEMTLVQSSLHYNLLGSYFNLAKDASKLPAFDHAGPKHLSTKQQLWTCQHSDYNQWLCDLTCTLINMSATDYLHCIMDSCRLSSSICKLVLPHVCLLLLSGSNKDIMVQFINSLFASANSITEKDPGIKVLSCMLDVIEWIRTYQYNTCSQSASLLRSTEPTSKKKNSLNDHLSGVNFLHISEVAIICKDPIAALLYLEIWAASNDAASAAPLEKHTTETKCLLAAVQYSQLGKKAGQLAVSAYTMLNELSALRACYAISSSSFSLASLCEKENRWMAALKNHDLNSSDDDLPHGKVFRSLQECGFDHISKVYAQSSNTSPSSKSNKEIEELRYKSAWQCGKWDEAVFMTNSTCGFHHLIYNHFVSLHLLQPNNFKFSLKKIRSICIESLSDQQRFVDFNQLNHVIVELQGVKETQRVYQMLSSFYSVEECVEEWKQLTCNLTTDRHVVDQDDFLMSIRTSLLLLIGKNLRNGCDHSVMLEAQASYHLKCIGFACKAARIQHAKQTLMQLNRVVERMAGSKGALRFSHQWWKYKVKFEEASLLWYQNEEAFALSALQNVLKDVKQYLDQSRNASETLLLASILQTAGVWCDSSKYEGASLIMNDYLKEGINLLERLNSSDPDDSQCTEQLVASHSTLAKFADRQLQEVLLYKSSQDYAEKLELTTPSTMELRQAAGHSMSKKTGIILEKSLNIDRQELDEMERKEKDFLISALRSYIRCLQLSDSLDTLLHRICALWFDHNDDEQVNQCIMESHYKLPSYKYVCLCYQLTARLSTADMKKTYAQLIKQILIRTTADHPHHTLPVLLAIVNAHKDDEIGQKSKNKVDTSNCSPVASVLQGVRSKRQSLLAANEKLALVYIELANLDATQWRNQPMKQIEFPRTLAINQLCNSKSRLCVELSNVVIPVNNVALDRRANYQQIPDRVLFSHFDRGFQTCGGINLPKVVVAVSRDGTKKKHLVKGKDDLRQDAVMQQVFELVNTLLLKLSKHDTLSIRGYKVVPLTQQSGLVEWCEGTLPIGIYLAGNPVQNVIGAHARLRPNDLPVLNCRKKMMQVSKQSVDVKHRTYLDVCSKFAPVFRHFFIENFPVPSDWFYARKQYTESVAVSSMIGYMLGLGDRHVQNILIDTNTAEVIHIDLGVAFEQGRCLPTPETVPFRLTRDLVDGMGLTGVEGSFRRCCEKTMTLLRSSFDVIIPIMEVLLHDPLHDWTIPPFKATRVQKKEAGGDTNTVLSFCNRNKSGRQTNLLAARALLKVKEKLKGCENGWFMSIDGQVNMLIQQAMDSRRLCQLFAGWQPYL